MGINTAIYMQCILPQALSGKFAIFHDQYQNSKGNQDFLKKWKY